MIYIILVCLYSYLILKVLLSVVPKGREIAKAFGLRISIIEFFVIAIVIAYLFNYYYLQQSEFKNFIVPVEVIWISFASSIFLFGIAIGARFILNIVENFIPVDKEVTFIQNKKVYDIFTLIWLNLSILMIFFSYSLMEISRPFERITDEVHVYTILGLSSLLGILFYFLHKEIHSLVKKITVGVMLLMCICLVLFTYESRINFLSNLPFTTSFITFNIAFLISLLVISAFQFRHVPLFSKRESKLDQESDEPIIQTHYSNQEVFHPSNQRYGLYQVNSGSELQPQINIHTSSIYKNPINSIKLNGENNIPYISNSPKESISLRNIR